jgi:hypothetical protein
LVHSTIWIALTSKMRTSDASSAYNFCSPFSPHVPSRLYEASAKKNPAPPQAGRSCNAVHRRQPRLSGLALHLWCVNAIAMLSIAACLHVPIRVARTPYAYGTSASVVLSRMASSATFAWNSGKWVCRFFSSDHFFRQATHINDWSETR